MAAKRRRESEPASTADAGDAEELRPDLRSDSAPATSAPFLSEAAAGKPPKCPPGSWRSHSDTSRAARKAALKSYKRSLSEEHLASPVRL